MGNTCIPVADYVKFKNKIKFKILKKKKKRIQFQGTFLAVQWLRLHLPMQGLWVQSLVRKLRYYMPLSQKTKT